MAAMTVVDAVRIAALCLVALPGCTGKEGVPRSERGQDSHGVDKGAASPAPGAEAKPQAAEPAKARALDPDGPKVRFGELVVEGPRNGGQLLEVIGSNAGAIQGCYSTTLVKHPEVAGELGIRFFVSAEGNVDDAILANSKITERSLQWCLMNMFKTFKFPVEPSGAATRATLPIFFGDTQTQAG